MEEVSEIKIEFHDINRIEINWSDSIKDEPKLVDCSFDDAMSGLDIYVLCLMNNIFPDEKSILFYNNYSNSDESIIGDYNIIHCTYPGYDQSFSLNTKKIDDKYDQILFVIGRPKTRTLNSENWIDQNLVKDVKNEKCFIECSINRKNSSPVIIVNIEYEYNKFGSLVLFEFKKANDSWKLIKNHITYTNGLKEIIEKHYKQGTNSV